MGLGHCGPERPLTAGRRGARGVKGFEMVELAAVDVPPLDVGFALIGGGSAVYHSFEGRFGSHGPVCNLPDPVLNGGWAVSVLLERRSHQGKLWGIWRFQAGARAFRRFQCQIQAFQRVQEGCPAIRRLGNLHLRGLHRRASAAGATGGRDLGVLPGSAGSIRCKSLIRGQGLYRGGEASP